MIRRREFITLLGGVAAAWPLAARAQQATMPLIGFLGLSSPDAFSGRLAAFKNGLAEAGFSENRNVEVIYRWAHDEADRLPRLAADLVNRNVNVIATTGGPAPAFHEMSECDAPGSTRSSRRPQPLIPRSICRRRLPLGCRVG